MNLLPEKEILSNNEIVGLTLTSHRIISQTDSFNAGFMTSIMLENIASIAVTRFNNPWILAIAVPCILTGLLLGKDAYNGTLATVIMFIGLCFSISYFLSIKKVIEIASSGGAVIRKTISNDVHMKQVHQVIEKIEDAKDARYMIGK